jgi:hypothetical protein
MIEMPTIHFMQPITIVSVIDAEQLRIADCGLRIRDREPDPPPEIRSPQSDDPGQALQQKKDELDRLLQTVGGIADGLHKLYEETLEGNRAEIARLAVEIAGRILVQSRQG